MLVVGTHHASGLVGEEGSAKRQQLLLGHLKLISQAALCGPDVDGEERGAGPILAE